MKRSTAPAASLLGAPKRFPRERFTKALNKLCERLDACSAARFIHRKKYEWATFTGRVDARVTGLWAFGSWVHGAAQCGDLDLLAQLEGEWATNHGGKPLPFDACIKHIVGRSLPHVHIFDHSEFTGPKSTVDVRDAVLIWAPGQNDWRAAIRSVEVNPGAGRMPRLHDAFPLTPLQVEADYSDIRELLLAQDAGVLCWEFIPDLRGKDELGLLTVDERLQLSEWSDVAGGMPLKSRAIEMTRVARAAVSAHKVQWRFGTLRLAYDDFQRRQGIELIVLAPRWSEAGPNGFLVVRKGPNQSPELLSEIRKQAAAQIQAEQAGRLGP